MKINELEKLSFADFLDFFKLLISILLYFVKAKKYSGCWLISERVDSAEDNGWIFYQWIKRNHPEQSVYFALGKKAIIIKEESLGKDENLVEWGSIKHFVMYLSSKMLIKTMFASPRPSRRICFYFEKYTSHKPQIIYLRHGISKDGIGYHCYQIQKARLFICGAKPEYDYINENGGYPEGYVQYTGFARFDDLIEHQRDERFVLIMPTWRRYIDLYSKTAQENEQRFLESSYYQHLHSLVQNKDLIDFIENAGYKVKFYMHVQFRHYLHLFKDADPRIEVLDDTVTVHDLLMSTSLLITDYSSVFFDVAYMKKPMVFYQFDYEEFRNRHFSEGYFSYERDGMGPVVETQDGVIEALKEFYDGEKFVNSEFYLKRCDNFFPTHDNHNCERIYNAIKAIEND